MTAPQTPHGVPGDARPVVRVDIRRRVSLGRNTRVQPGDMFFVTVTDDGEIHLKPAGTYGSPRFNDPTTE
jgi:hypothetical protein